MTDETTKPRTEVTEETRETLSVLELDRKPRPEKMRLEQQYFDGAHEVRFTERTFRPRHKADLDEVRAFVDSLEVRRKEPTPLPEPPAPTPVHVQVKVPDHYREPLEAAIPGALVSVETVHRVGTGTVVDVAWEPADGGLRRGLYLVDEGSARPYEDVAARIDALPAPTVAAPQAASAPEPEPEKKRRLGFGRKEKAAEPKPEAPAPQEPEEPSKKRRFGLRRGK